MRVAGSPNPDHPSRRHDHLWLLVGGGDYADGAMAYYLGGDRDIEGNDFAGDNLARVVKEHGLNMVEARNSLERYRILAKTV
jgi:hypothetical protein